MKSIAIVTNSFLNISDKSLKIGGLETYIYYLAKLGLKEGYKIVVFQVGEKNEICNIDGINVELINLKNKKEIYDYTYKKSKSGLLIIATDQLGLKVRHDNVIVIQHGIAFDKPREFEKGAFKNYLINYALKIARSYLNVRRYNRSTNIVCVDYNYYNWLKISTNIDNDKFFKVIPNFVSAIKSISDVKAKLDSHDGSTYKILFARRFTEYRGTRLFANVVLSLLERHSNIEITFAGEGEDEEYLYNTFKNNKRVYFTKFTSTTSIDFHYAYDIAVIPTIYSEGTSLSLLEAMAAGCYVVATHVGGITNMIIDNYNGNLVYPRHEDLLECLSKVVKLDSKKFRSTVINGWYTANEGFDLNLWEDRWRCVFLHFKYKSC